MGAGSLLLLKSGAEPPSTTHQAASLGGTASWFWEVTQPVKRLRVSKPPGRQALPLKEEQRMNLPPSAQYRLSSWAAAF